MAKSLPLVAPRSFILRIKLHCSKCESRTKLFLERIPGLHSATINRKEGTVIISGTVKPSGIITLLEQGIGVKADLLWDQTPTPPPSPSASSKGAQDLEVIPRQSRIVESDNHNDHQRFMDPHNHIISQLNQLSRLESVEIKLNFRPENHDASSNVGDVKVVIHGGSGGSPDVSNGGFRGPDVSNGGFRGHDASNGGFRGHDASNGGFRGHDISNGSSYDLAYGYPVTSTFNGCPNLQWPPPWSGGYSPSAPPAYDDAPPPPPPAPERDNSFFNQFSDDNTSSCTIM